MFCKWCGLESETTDVCSWCRKPFSSAATQNAPQNAPQNAGPSTPVEPSAPAPALTPAYSPIYTPLAAEEELPPPPAASVLPGLTAAPPTPTPVAAPEPAPAPGPTPMAGAFPLGGFDDDDLSPMPFGAGAPSAPPADPDALPPTFAPSAPATAAPSPAPSPTAIPVTPAPDAASGADQAPMEAIPIKLRKPPLGGSGAAPPPPIPIKGGSGRPSLPFTPVPGQSSTARPQAPAPASDVGRPPAAQPPASQPGPAPTFTPPAPSYNPLGANAAPAAPAAPAPQPAQQSVQQPVQQPQARAPLAGMPADEPAAGPMDLGLQPLAPTEEAHDIGPLASPAGRRIDLTGAPAPALAAQPGYAPPSARTATPTAVPPRGGRTWFCRWCGMESESADTCTWCHKDLRSVPASSGKPTQVTITHGPTKTRGPVRQPVAKQTPRPAPQPAQKTAPTPNGPAKPLTTEPHQNGSNGLPHVAPQLGTFQAAKSKYYADQVYDPVSGAHYDADTGKTTDEPVSPIEYDVKNDKVQLAIYAGVFVVMLCVMYGLATSGIVNSVAGYFLLLGVFSFIAGILLPVLYVAPWSNDDQDDTGWALGLTVLLGPFAGAMGYGVLGMVRGGDWNPAIVGVFVTSLLLRVVLDVATGHSLGKMVPFSEMSGLVLGAQVMPLVTLAGWYAAEVFHKPDE